MALRKSQCFWPMCVVNPSEIAMRLVDFHCHLDLYSDPEAAITEAAGAGVYPLAVTTTPRAWPRNRLMTSRTTCVRAALGLHPQLVAEHSKELALWEQYLPETRYIGEVGLDAGPQHYRSLDLQKEIFERILLACAKAGEKILTVHSVRAATPVLDLVERCLPPSRGGVVLHWFTGTKSELRRAADLGCYFSVNTAMTERDRGRALIADIPMDRLLTETDGPFTTIAGRPTRPSDVATVIEKLAAIRSVPHPELAGRIIANLRTLLGAAGDQA